jgi:hypothetical protein
MKETKTVSGTPEARAAMHEMMAAFEAFKGANDARLDEIERKRSADALLEEKVARIDQAVGAAQARLDRSRLFLLLLTGGSSAFSVCVCVHWGIYIPSCSGLSGWRVKGGVLWKSCNRSSFFFLSKQN